MFRERDCTKELTVLVLLLSWIGDKISYMSFMGLHTFTVSVYVSVIRVGQDDTLGQFRGPSREMW